MLLSMHKIDEILTEGTSRHAQIHQRKYTAHLDFANKLSGYKAFMHRQSLFHVLSYKTALTISQNYPANNNL